MPRLRLYSTMFFSRGGTGYEYEYKSLRSSRSVLTLNIPKSEPGQRREDEVAQEAEDGRDEVQVHSRITAYSIRIQPVPQVRDWSAFEPEGQETSRHKQPEKNRRDDDSPTSFPPTSTEYAQQEKGESGL